MSRHLLIAVHLHADGMGTARYHGVHGGVPEWPPAPARVFQAMVAGSALGQSLPEALIPALQWLEQLPPPVIAAPVRTVGQAVSLYVPNNDADALADPTDVSTIRTAKRVQPSLFDGQQPLMYAWTVPGEDGPAQALTEAVQAVYQLGRGVDMAWADVRWLDEDALHALLIGYRGVVHQPAHGFAASPSLLCPVPGSLDSLMLRHRAPRLRSESVGKKARTVFTNPPKPRFAAIGYAPLRRSVAYDLQDRDTAGAWPWPLDRVAILVERVREAAAIRLRAAMPDESEVIDRCLLGRSLDGRGTVDLAQRVRILPLPSIGTRHADQAVRRLVVEMPEACPLGLDDLTWALSGLDHVDGDTGEVSPWLLTRADDVQMQAHYSRPSRYWQSVTAVVLPRPAARRRIDPARQRDEAKSASERQREESRAVDAVCAALRHAGVLANVAAVHVQREPFNGRGRRADSFAGGTRFEKERCWHVAISFDRPVEGPLAIGDGRFVGLGMLAPSAPASGFNGDPAAWTGEASDGVAAMALQNAVGEAQQTEPVLLARAFRRAVMARVQTVRGEGVLPAFFSGHVRDHDAPDASPSRHLAFHWDGPRARWIVLAPHRLERRAAYRWEREHLVLLNQALEGMSDLRAGVAGRHSLCKVALAQDDPLLATAAVWDSVTPYDVTRHRRLASAADAVRADVLAECERCGLSPPRVEILSMEATAGRGLHARLRLVFDRSVAGPIALGRSSLLGGGLFAAVLAEGPATAVTPNTQAD